METISRLQKNVKFSHVNKREEKKKADVIVSGGKLKVNEKLNFNL